MVVFIHKNIVFVALSFAVMVHSLRAIVVHVIIIHVSPFSLQCLVEVPQINGNRTYDDQFVERFYLL